MSRSSRSWDESDVRVRPNRRGSRPRTKDRPKHEDAIVGRVTAVDRGRWTTLVPAGEGLPERVVIAMRARELGRSPVVVGDRVAMVGDTSGAPDTLARIVRIEERATVLRRTADDTDPVERVIVANADQLVVVAALADPEPRPRLIDRCLVAAYDAGMDPLLVLTKSDLASAEDFLAQYAPSTSRTSSPLSSPRAAKGWPSCAVASPAESPCSSATRASASRPWSTRCAPTPTGPPGTSTTSPVGDDTPRPAPSACGCRLSPFARP